MRLLKEVQLHRGLNYITDKTQNPSVSKYTLKISIEQISDEWLLKPPKPKLGNFPAAMSNNNSSCEGQCVIWWSIQVNINHAQMYISLIFKADTNLIYKRKKLYLGASAR